MYGEARKLHLIEAILRTEDTTVLNRLEAILSEATQMPAGRFTSFAGIWNGAEAAAVEKAISEGCEQVHKDDWN